MEQKAGFHAIWKLVAQDRYDRKRKSGMSQEDALNEVNRYLGTGIIAGCYPIPISIINSKGETFWWRRNQKEAAINDNFSVTKLLGFLLHLQHHTSIKRLICQTIL